MLNQPMVTSLIKILPGHSSWRTSCSSFRYQVALSSLSDLKNQETRVTT